MDCLVFIFKLMKLHHTCKARTSSTLAEESSVHIVIYSSQDFSESFLLLLFDTILPYTSLTRPSSNALFQNCLVRYRHAVFIFTIFLRGLDNIFEVWRGSSVTILNCLNLMIVSSVRVLWGSSLQSDGKWRKKDTLVHWIGIVKLGWYDRGGYKLALFAVGLAWLSRSSRWLL